MEIIGIGSDIVECVRIGRMIERHGEVFLERVYTAREIRVTTGWSFPMPFSPARCTGDEVHR